MTRLTYCTNVHPAETLEGLLELLGGPVRRVRQAWCPERPMGVGLWLPRAVARGLVADPDAVDRARAVLEEAGLFAFTVNAFPIGGFHAERVKRDVYRPTWLEAERADYTLEVFRALEALLPEGERGSVSTVPVSYKAFGHDDALEAAGAHLGRVGAELERAARERGRDLALALEPEPLATLETTDELVAFLEAHVFAGAGRAAAAAAGLGEAGAEAALRRRVGACVDTCHLACEFEELKPALERLAGAGVRVVKAQLSSALELRDPAANPAGRARLAAFAEPRYLHQSLGRRGSGEVARAEDLPDLFPGGGADLTAAFDGVERIRTHFHVPLCWEGDDGLGTTRPVLEAGLEALAAATDHLEVETYTFSVLPEADRARYGDDPVVMITEELRWAEAALARAGRTLR